MSSVGQVVGGVVGAIVGFYAGGPSGALYGAQIGMMGGTLLDPPKGPHTSSQGPRLNDLTVQTSSYGVAIPRVRGKIATFGNVIWLLGNKLTEVPVVTETSSGGKGGGGATQTSTTFEYFATFAVGLCEGPVTGIGRIWVGGNLVYDGTSLDPATISAGLTTDQFTFYPGSDTQMPDPTIQADRGIANTPAYRGLAYLVFHNFPLKDYGNSLMGAQVKVEVIANGGTTHTVQFQGQITTGPATVYHGVIRGEYLYSVYANLIIHNISDPQHMYQVGISSSTQGFCLALNGDYALVGGYNILRAWNILTPSSPAFYKSIAIPGYAMGIVVAGYFAYTIGTNDLICIDISGLLQPAGMVVVSNLKTSPIAENEGKIAGSNGYLYVACDSALEVYTEFPCTLVASMGLPSNTFGRNLTINGGFLYLTTYNPSSLTIIDISNPLSPAIVGGPLSLLTSGASSVEVCGNYAFITSAKVSIINVEDKRNPFVVDSTSVDLSAYHISVRDGYIFGITNYPYTLKSYFFADNISTVSPPTLGSIVSAECLSSRLLTAGDIDVTDLTDIVTGYRVSAVGSIRTAIEPLRASWPFDVVQHGYQLKFKRRGSASVVTIPWDQLDARKAGGSQGVRVTNSREMDSILPCKVTLKHFDTGREYDVGEQYAERINTDAINVTSVDLPLAMTATEAAQKADALLYLYWLERYDIAFVLPPPYGNLEPGDSLTITTDDMTYNLRLVSVNYLPDGRLECAAKYNYPAVYVSQAVGSEGQETGTVLTVSGSTVYELLDIPCLQDAYNVAGFPLAMGGFLAGWPGGSLIRSPDLLTWATLQGVSAPGARQGFATTTLSAHPGTMLDKSGTLAARIYQGELSSITESAMLNGGNHFAYGLDGRWEIIAAQNCVLQADGTYILSDFLRGRFGTEWATGQHAVGDHLVLLDYSALKWIGMDINVIGLSRTYRGITLGKDITTDMDRSFAYNGVNLECLSPVYLNGNRAATNDWNLTWLRRTRVGGEWRDYVDATLGETTEAYDVEVYDSTYATLKRTISVTAAAAIYTSAQQVTDFGANQTTLYLRIYQLSSTVGRGYYLQTSITR